MRDPLGEAVGCGHPEVCPPAPQQLGCPPGLAESGLPCCTAHSNISEVPYKPTDHGGFETEPWMLDEEIYVQPKAVQGGHYIVLDCVQVLILKGQSQFLTYSEKKGLEESWVVMEKGYQGMIWRPPAGDLGQMALHRLLCCYSRSVGSWMAMRSSCLVPNN